MSLYSGIHRLDPYSNTNEQVDFTGTLVADLVTTVQHAPYDDALQEAVAIVGDTNTWSVKVVSSFDTNRRGGLGDTPNRRHNVSFDWDVL